MPWEELHTIYRQRGLALGLGAGVSITSGLPSWESLLVRIVQDNPSLDADTTNELERSGFSLPAIASFLEAQYSNRDSFAEVVRRQLYRDFPFYPAGYPLGDSKLMVEFVRLTNSTLRSIGALCARRAGRSKSSTLNPRLKAITTFNLDFLLQAYVAAKFGDGLIQTVGRPSSPSNPDLISVYHAHGVLQFDRRSGDPRKEAPDTMVLTEQDYFDVFNDPTSFFTYTFLHVLREHSVLFIGLSMNDDNLRRLLHYSRAERERSLQAQGTPEGERDGLLRHFAILLKPEQEALRKATRSTLEALGTEVLWVESFTEIPERLKGLYESGGDRWDAVY